MSSTSHKPTKALPFVVVLKYTEPGWPERTVKYRAKTLERAKEIERTLRTKGMLKTCPGSTTIESLTEKNPMKWSAAKRANFARRMKLARARKGRRRVRKVNPTPWRFRVVIKATPKHGGAPLYFNGRNFSSNKLSRRYFSSIATAKAMALHQLKKHAVLRRAYKVALYSA